MKTTLHTFMVLVFGLFAFTGAMGQKTSSEYDDIYYRPSEKKQAPAVEKQEAVTPQEPAYVPDNYEKYINNLENQRINAPQQVNNDDTLEYAEDRDYVGSDYYEKDGSTYVTNNYYNTDDSYYTSRIRRFYDPFYSMGYYDSWYNDPFMYQPGWSFNMSFGYPYSGFGFSYGWPGYSPWYSDYYFGYSPYSSWYYPYYGWGYGFNHGYYNGYNYGNYYGYNDGYYPNHHPIYYGPRRAIEANRIASAGSPTSLNGRRISSSNGATSRVATGTRQNTGTLKSTNGAGTPVRRPYGSVNSSSGNTERRISNNSNVTPTTRELMIQEDNSTIRKSTEDSYVAPQERPVYSRPSSTTTQSRPSYSGTPANQSSGTNNRSFNSENRSSTYSRPASAPSSTYSRPSSSPAYRSTSSSPSYSRPSSSSSSYSRSSSSGSSYSSGSSRSSSSGSSSSGSSRSSAPSSGRR